MVVEVRVIMNSHIDTFSVPLKHILGDKLATSNRHLYNNILGLNPSASWFLELKLLMSPHLVELLLR